MSNTVIPVTHGTRAVAATSVSGVAAVCDPTGALYLPDSRTLVVSDMHLERGAAFARLGMLLPPYDTAAKIAILEKVILHYRPACVVSLGDSFHDRRGSELLSDANRSALRSLTVGREWVWIGGNHDPDAVVGIPGVCAAMIDVSGIALRHEPGPPGIVGEIAGHLHPSATVIRRNTKVRRPCFASDGSRMIMPAFGTVSGGLDLDHRAMSSIFHRSRLVAYVLGTDRVYTVTHDRLRA